MRIRDVRTYLVGNAWKNWLFVRLDTDEGIHGVGAGSGSRIGGRKTSRSRSSPRSATQSGRTST